MNEGIGFMQLVRQARAGDDAAEEKLLTHLRPMIKRLARLAGNKDTEDLEQELYITLLQLVRQYRPPHPP